MENKEKYAKLGKPSLFFGWGQEKRFQLVKQGMDFKNKKVLDYGCGIGMYSKRFQEEDARVWGVDINKQDIIKAQKRFEGIVFIASESEAVPIEDNFFDLVFSNEVIEHVADDKKAIREMIRVLKPGGKLIIFAPNKWFPFETHGIYLGKKYIFGNIPFLSWMPGLLRKVFAPHVKIYTKRRIKKLFLGQKVSFEKIDYVWPAFDKVERKIPLVGKYLKRVGEWAEKTPCFKKLGISIFITAKKI